MRGLIRQQPCSVPSLSGKTTIEAAVSNTSPDFPKSFLTAGPKGDPDNFRYSAQEITGYAAGQAKGAEAGGNGGSENLPSFPYPQGQEFWSGCRKPCLNRDGKYWGGRGYSTGHRAGDGRSRRAPHFQALFVDRTRSAAYNSLLQKGLGCLVSYGTLEEKFLFTGGSVPA